MLLHFWERLIYEFNQVFGDRPEGTLGLMTEFYAQLKTAPTKAEALRQAQIAMLRGQIRKEEGQLKLASLTAIPLPAEMFAQGEVFTHPYYWSAFTVIGNWN